MTKRHFRRGLFSCALAFAALSSAVFGRAATKVVLSRDYLVDRFYKSMEGPSSVRDVVLDAEKPPGLLWITGFKTEMVGPRGKRPRPADFMCHANLDFADMARHRALFGWKKNVSIRIATLSQGQLSVRFPPGYGMPLMSDEPLSVATQVLNFNHPGSYRVRHKITIEFAPDKGAGRPMKPLFADSPFVMVSLDGRPEVFGAARPTPAQAAAACAPGQNAPNAMMGSVYTDAQGRRYSGHFAVPPGRHVYRTLATHLLNLPFDTRVHYIEAHLHPFAVSLALRDLTAGKTLWTARAKERADAIGLSEVGSYSSESGLPLYKSHDYELVAVYNNTSGRAQDAMAVMTLYMQDKGFRRPASTAATAARIPAAKRNHAS
ncbi:MAG TPA: hypothetical protein VNK24_06220 [Elusimicrobiota bacterium]|nr:hypothetical protein [Elusimicrobiota bacterium]